MADDPTTIGNEDTPVGIYGASVAGVRALVPEARLLDTLPTGPGVYGVTFAQVEEWLREVTGVVAIKLDGWERLSTDPTAVVLNINGAPAGPSDREQLIAAARTIVHNGAAAYLEAARHPERARPNDSSYADVLWRRYELGLEQLATWLAGRLIRPVAGDDEEQPLPVSGVLYDFPPPLIGDALRF